MDGININDVLEMVAETRDFGVSQEPVLFSGTIFDNMGSLRNSKAGGRNESNIQKTCTTVVVQAAKRR